MFRIDCFVKDKDVGEVLKRLTNIAMNVNYVFVPNVESERNGKLRVTGQDAFDLITKELHKRKLTEITGSDFRVLMDEIGLNAKSYSYFMANLARAGVLKKGKPVAGPKGVRTICYSVTGK